MNPAANATNTRQYLKRLRTFISYNLAYSLALTICLCLLPNASTAKDKQSNATSLAIRYHGELVDQLGSPVTAILPLTFHIVKQGSNKVIWKGKQWVSVLDGHFDVILGDSKLNANTHQKLDIIVWLHKKRLLRASLANSPYIRIKKADRPATLVGNDIVQTAAISFDDNAEQVLDCPKNHIAVGIRLTQKDSRNFIQLRCAPISHTE